MNDYLGMEIKRGDWIFYATRRGYRFARVIYFEKGNIPKWDRVCVLPVLREYKDKWRTGIKSYVYNPPFRVTEIPNSVLEAARKHKMWREWFND